MPEVFIAAAEGEWALYQSTPLNSFVDSAQKHRGSTQISNTAVMFRGWSETQASNDMWFHVLAARNDGSSNSGGPQTFIDIRDGDSQFMAGFRDADIDFSTAFAVFPRYSSSASAGDNLQGPVFFENPNAVWIEFDIRIRISTVTNPNDTMTVDYYVQQQLRFTTTVTDAAGWTPPRELYLRALHTQTSRDTVHYMDVIVSDGIPTVGMELVTMTPAATGFYSTFTNNYTNVDEEGYDPNDLIFATAAGQRESFIMTTPTFDTSDKIIYAFVLSSVAQTDLANVVSDFQPFLRINATDYAGTNMGANNIAPDNYATVWTQNPATLAPWEQSDFDGLEVGYLTV
jgi:hypothetical protein